MALNEKGQAAITDAMYFLIIITALTVFVYPFTINYGESVLNQFSSQYKNAYADSALKSLLYLSVPRDFSQSIDDADEMDLLLTLVKEDYAVDNNLSDNTMKLISKKVFQTMYFVNPAFDYYFYFKSTQSKHIFFVFAKLSVVYVNNDKSVDYEVLHFYCAPDSADKSGPLNTFLNEDLYIMVGDVARPPSTIMFFPEFASDGTTVKEPRKVEAVLALWVPPTPMPAYIDLSSLDVATFDSEFGGIDCVEFKVPEDPNLNCLNDPESCS